MRTRMIQWLDTRTTVSGTRAALRMRVLFGVQVKVDGKWMHAHRNGKPLIFRTKERAQSERTKLRAMPLPPPPAEKPQPEQASMMCQPNGLMFDALGNPRTRYVRVSLDGSHCVMRPSEGDSYLKDARDAGDESAYVVADVWISEREFDDLPEHNGF